MSGSTLAQTLAIPREIDVTFAPPRWDELGRLQHSTTTKLYLITVLNQPPYIDTVYRFIRPFSLFHRLNMPQNINARQPPTRFFLWLLIQ